VDLRQAHGKVVTKLLEHAGGSQRFGQVPGLADKVPAYNADRIRVERGFNPYHVLHDFRRHCQILASHEFHSREHGFPLSLSRLEYYVSAMAAARRVYENPHTICERNPTILRKATTAERAVSQRHDQFLGQVEMRRRHSGILRCGSKSIPVM